MLYNTSTTRLQSNQHLDPRSRLNHAIWGAPTVRPKELIYRKSS